MILWEFAQWIYICSILQMFSFLKLFSKSIFNGCSSWFYFLKMRYIVLNLFFIVNCQEVLVKLDTLKLWKYIHQAFYPSNDSLVFEIVLKYTIWVYEFLFFSILLSVQGYLSARKHQNYIPVLSWHTQMPYLLPDTNTIISSLE